jgi:YcxB-like protein
LFRVGRTLVSAVFIWIGKDCVGTGLAPSRSSEARQGVYPDAGSLLAVEGSAMPVQPSTVRPFLCCQKVNPPTKCRAMQIDYELTQKDFTESYAVHRNRNALSKWGRRLFVWIVLLLALLVFLGFLVKPSAQSARNLLPFFGFVLAWLGILWILPRWLMRRQFLKQPGAHGPRTVVLGDSGAHWQWDGGSSHVEWKNYIRSAEGKNQILFYTSPACFNILPKCGLTATQLDELRSLLKQNIPSTR